jgi:hypothetical protein
MFVNLRRTLRLLSPAIDPKRTSLHVHGQIAEGVPRRFIV